MKVRATGFDCDASDVERAIRVIGGKWKVRIICHLLGGTKRFSELRRLLPGVHRGTLTYELRRLQADSIIHCHPSQTVSNHPNNRGVQIHRQWSRIETRSADSASVKRQSRGV